MCSEACIAFAEQALKCEEIEGRTVIDVGSMDVNGTVRGVIEKCNPASYLGVDIGEGPGVDEICSVGKLVDRYGKDRFDIVLTTELLEHVREWREAMSNLKNVLKPGGILLITTRSKGFGYHAFPFDFWRYEPEDAEEIFSDFSVEISERDPEAPGIFLKLRKPGEYKENSLDSIELYSILRGKRCKDINWLHITLFRIKWLIRRGMAHILPGPIKRAVKEAVLKED